MSQRKTRIVVDMQFGSTGKGLIAGYMAEEYPCDTVVSAWGPNAGHTYIDSQGRKFIHTMLPNGIVSPDLERILLGPGSVINADALAKELINAEATLGVKFLDRLFIHQNAAIVTDHHRANEEKFVRVGSTMKGTAEAAIEKLRRDPEGRATAGQNRQALGYGLADRVVSADVYDAEMDKGRMIQAEGAQGFSLGVNQRFYPFATSRECTTAQVISDCGIPMADNEIQPVGTIRTYPIRVANRFADECMMPADGSAFGVGALTPACGHRATHMIHTAMHPKGHTFAPRQIGTSGPCYSDQTEITFESIGQPVEMTTVTKLPRRIFTFSEMQFRAALRANGPRFIFLNFLNYIPVLEHHDWIGRVARIANEYGARLQFLGTGATHHDIEEI